MTITPLPLARLFAALAIAITPIACAGEGAAQGDIMNAHPNSIQPETTLNISAESTIMAEPDIAFLTAGVESEAKTAQAAMSANARAMNGVFDALKKAGVARKDMQTSNFSLHPRYDYIKSITGSNSGQRRLAGYTVSNQLTVKVRDLDNLGATMDALVNAGGNTFSGIRFALDNDKGVRDQARSEAMKEALAKAELYASAAGYKVARIVTISEGGDYNPQPMREMAMARMADSAPTPIASGEVGYTSRVNVMFELKR